MSTTAKKVDQTLNQELAAMDDTSDWETRVIVVGGILGAVVGLLTSYLLIRTSKEAHAGPPAITTGALTAAYAFGAFVSLLPGKDGLLHISEVRKLAGGKRIDSVEDVLSIGQKILVKITKVDDRGKLSLEPVLEDAEQAETAAESAEVPAAE